jgi:hypothetical protein
VLQECDNYPLFDLLIDCCVNNAVAQVDQQRKILSDATELTNVFARLWASRRPTVRSGLGFLLATHKASPGTPNYSALV